MTWSYDDSLPTDRDKVRFRIGDTDSEEELLSNETLDALLVIRDDVVLASIDAYKRSSRSSRERSTVKLSG